jgi:signal transduction histidine kinase
MFGKLGRFIISINNYVFSVNVGSKWYSYLFGIFFFGWLTSDILVQAQQRPALPPMSLQDIREEITQMESAEDKLQYYVEMSNRYLRNSPDSMLAAAEEIKKIEGLGTQKKEAFSMFIAANAWRLLNPDSAIHYGSRASEMLRELNEHNSYLTVENLRATQYQLQEDYVQAESLYFNAISYQENIKEEIDFPVRYFYGNLGNLYVNVGAYDLAIDMYEKFLSLADFPQDRCNILSKLSTSFAALGDVDKGIELLSICLEYENLPPPIQAIVRGNLSKLYREKGESTRSLSLLEEATSITSQYRIPNIGNSNLVQLGNMYVEIGMIEKADSVARMLNSPEIRFIRPQEQITKSRFFTDLDFSKNDFESALFHASEAIRLAEESNSKALLGDIYSVRAEAYEQMGQLDKALENQRLQRELDREQNELANERKLEMQSVRYQLENKEAQLLNINSELENVKTRVILVVSMLILIVGYVFYRYRLYYLLREEKTRTRIAMDLHDDLSGTLSSISFFSKAVQKDRIYKEGPQKFLNMIDESATEAKEKINDIIWAIDPSKDDWSVFLKKCKRFAADAFDSKDIEYEIEISETFKMPVELELRQNLWLIFKEMVNNLVTHSEATKAFISFKEIDGKIHLEVADNGIGIDVERESNRNGLKNIRQRAVLIGAKLKLETTAETGAKWILSFSK